MSEKGLDKAWTEFCSGNPELLYNHTKIINTVFRAGWLAAKSKQSKGDKK